MVKQFEKFSLNFSIPFVIRVNFSILNNHLCSLMGYYVLSLWCFSIFGEYYYQVSFNLKVILAMVKITQNMMTLRASLYT